MQNKKSATTVHHIKDKHGNTHSSNKAIADQFEQYYHSLYKPLNVLMPTSYSRIPTNSSPLSTDTAHKLEAPLSETEFEKAIKHMKVGKAPGPDGPPLQCYKIFSDVLKLRFLAASGSLQPGKQL